MRNENIKKDFLSLGNAYCEKYFKLLEPIEDRYDKDLSLFTVDEILGAYKYLGSFSYDYIANINRVLLKYTQYCLHEKLVPDGQNHYSEITSDIINSCLNRAKLLSRILTQKDIIEQTRNFPTTSDECLVQAVFEGVCGRAYKELANLNVSQLEGKILHLETRDLEVSTRLIELMHEASDEKVFPINTQNGVVYMPYDKNDTGVFKGAGTTRNEDDSHKRARLYYKMYKIQKYMGGAPAYTYNALRDSGRIHMIKEFMAQDGTEAQDAILNHKKEIDARFMSKIASIRKFVDVYKEFLQEGGEIL